MPLDIARIREQSASSFGKHYHTKAKRDKRFVQRSTTRFSPLSSVLLGPLPAHKNSPNPVIEAQAPLDYSTRSRFARRNDDEI